MVAKSVGGAVCLACFREVTASADMLSAVGQACDERDQAKREVEVHSRRADDAERANAALRDDLERMTILRNRLATDALCALAGAGIATPETGYIGEPVCLTGDVAELAKQRDDALKEQKALERDLAQMMSPEVDAKISHRAMTFRIRNAAAMNEVGQMVVRRVDYDRLEKGRDERLREAELARITAESALIEQREVLLGLKNDRDAYREASIAAVNLRQEAQALAGDRLNQIAELRKNLALVSDLAAQLGAAR